MRLYDGIDGIDDMEMISTDVANNEFWRIQYIYNIIQYIYIIIYIVHVYLPILERKKSDSKHGDGLGTTTPAVLSNMASPLQKDT
jgi:hypothetical protein